MSLLDRISVWRRIASALESIAKSQATLADLAREAEERRVHDMIPPERKQMEVGTFDASAASKRWRADQISRGVSEDELEEEYGPLD